MSTLGLVLTSTDSLASLLDALRATPSALGPASPVPGPVLKVVTGWGLPRPWTRPEIASLIGLVRSRGGTLLVRTAYGDPSRGHDWRFPFANQVAAELALWLELAPEAWVEIGNEWLIAPQPEAWAYEYVSHLGAAISAVRSRWPKAKLIAPAHMLNHPVALGAHTDGVVRCLQIAAESYRRCDALATHAYTAAQLARGLSLLRTHVSGKLPVWLTEFALNADLAPADRARAYRDLLVEASVDVALLYHLDELGGSDPIHHNPHYALDLPILRALSAPPPPPTLDELGIEDIRAKLPLIRSRRPAPRKGPPTSVTLHYNGPAVVGFGNPDAERRQIIMVDAPWHQHNPDILGDSLQYHYCVLSDGTILQTRDPALPAAHCGHKDGNRDSLAVHLPLGGVQDAKPAQWAAAERLFQALIAKYDMPGGRDAVRGHREWKPTTLCPGPNLTRRLEAWRAKSEPAGGLYRIRRDVAAANVREGPGTSYPIALGGRAQMWPGDVLDADATVTGEAVGGDTHWLHRRDGVGFVHRSLVEGL